MFLKTQVNEDDALREVNPFINILDNFSSRLPHTSEEVVVVVLMSDLSFVQNLPEGDNIEMTPELSYKIFKYPTIFSILFVE